MHEATRCSQNASIGGRGTCSASSLLRAQHSPRAFPGSTSFEVKRDGRRPSSTIFPSTTWNWQAPAAALMALHLRSRAPRSTAPQKRLTLFDVRSVSALCAERAGLYEHSTANRGCCDGARSWLLENKLQGGRARAGGGKCRLLRSLLCFPHPPSEEIDSGANQVLVRL